MAKSDTHANAILDAIGDMTLHTATYVSLHTGDPGGTGASEVSGGSYARVQVNTNGGASPSWNAAATSAMDNNGAITFPEGGGDASVTHFGLYDASSAGTSDDSGPVILAVAAAGTSPGTSDDSGLTILTVDLAGSGDGVSLDTGAITIVGIKTPVWASSATRKIARENSATRTAGTKSDGTASAGFTSSGSIEV